MDSVTAPSKLLYFLLLTISAIHLVSSSSVSPPPGTFLSESMQLIHQRLKTHIKHGKAIRRDFMNPPFPATPVTNPVTTPSTGGLPASPAIVTVPSANPVAGLPTTPFTNPTASPVTNPVTTPTIGGQPLTNPVGTYPAVAPPATNNAAGQTWCVAKSGIPDSAVQAGLDYACGFGGADCSAIQQGAACYSPNTLQYHASYAFNSYFQRNPAPTSCDFGGTAMITNANPSTGACIFATASPAMAYPGTAIPTPVPTTESSTGATPTSSGTPQPFLNAGNPALGGGASDNPFIGNSSSSVSGLSRLQPWISCAVTATSIIVTSRVVLVV